MRVLMLLMVLLVAGSAHATDNPLQLREVLDSVVHTHPKAGAVAASVEQARGELLSSRGDFDPKLTGAASSNPAGYYENSRADVGLSQRVPGTGVVVKGRYRVSRGDIAPYYGERRTQSGGEISAAVSLPLLRDFRTDAARTEIDANTFELRGLVHSQRSTELALVRDASKAYFEWVAAGQVLGVARELLAIAEARAATVGEQASRGLIPRIEEVDARRIVLARKDRLLKARANFLKAQQSLSLYYRSQSLKPLVVDEARVPAVMSSLPLLADAALAARIDRAIANRPEIAQLEEQMREVRTERKLANNDRLPSLNLQAYGARDLGRGDPSLGQTDFGIGLNLSFPILQRKARGKAMASESKLAKLTAEARGLRDRMRAEFWRASQVATLRHEQALLAEERWSATRRLAEAEQVRLAQGASDILRVNLRERDMASAASDSILAALQRNVVLADLHFLLMTESGGS